MKWWQTIGCLHFCVTSAGFEEAVVVVWSMRRWCTAVAGCWKQKEETLLLLLPSRCPYSSSHFPPCRYDRTIYYALAMDKQSPKKAQMQLGGFLFFLWSTWSEEHVCVAEEAGNEQCLSVWHEYFRNKCSLLAVPPYTVWNSECPVQKQCFYAKTCISMILYYWVFVETDGIAGSGNCEFQVNFLQKAFFTEILGSQA